MTPGIRQVDLDAEAARLIAERNRALPVHTVSRGDLIQVATVTGNVLARIVAIEQDDRQIVLRAEAADGPASFTERVADAINALGPVVGVDGRVRAHYQAPQ